MLPTQERERERDRTRARTPPAAQRRTAPHHGWVCRPNGHCDQSNGDTNSIQLYHAASRKLACQWDGDNTSSREAFSFRQTKKDGGPRAIVDG